MGIAMSEFRNNTAPFSKKRLRAYARINLEGEVFIHNEEDLYVAPLNNLSAGGCFVDQLNTLPQGSEVKVIVKSARLQNPIQAAGVIVRVEDSQRKGSAIEFTSLNAQSREEIQTLVYENKIQNVLKVM